MKSMACVLALAAGTSVAGGAGAQTAQLGHAASQIPMGLRLSFSSPGTVSGDNPVTLDVNFRGGSVQSVELLLDGNQIYKQDVKTRDAKGVFHFNLKESLLSEGDHEVIVNAVDQSGNTASSTTHFRVASAPQDPTAHFAFPKQNAMVQGVVPISVQIDSSIHNPYVAFYVDNEFKSFSNYSTMYNWDSSKVANGPHTLDVKIFDERTTAELKSITIHVNVNNVGGFTNVQTTIPNLGGKDLGLVSLPVATIAMEAANSSSGLARGTDGSASSIALRAGHGPNFMSSAFALDSHSAPGVFVPGIQADGSVLLPDSIIPTALRTQPTTAISSNTPGSLPNTRPGHLGVTANLDDVLASPQDLNALNVMAADSGRLARLPSRPRRSGNIAAVPMTELASAVGAVSAPTAPAAPRPAGHVMRPVAGRALNANSLKVKTFNVAFDNQRIAFDVPPRVENGLPMAPFRAIFEHTGGKLQWFAQSQTVRAVNNEREIEIKIGDRDAKVNNQTVAMETTPYIDHGRTIVPLSFVQDAMNVKVTFDAATGRLLIESKK